MGESVTEKLSELPAARREHILAEADHLDTESLSLQELRKTKRLTQAQLAEVLKRFQRLLNQRGFTAGCFSDSSCSGGSDHAQPAFCRYSSPF